MKRSGFKKVIQKAREEMNRDMYRYGRSEGVCDYLVLAKGGGPEFSELFADIFRPKGRGIDNMTNWWLGDWYRRKNFKYRRTFLDMFEAVVLSEKLYKDL